MSQGLEPVSPASRLGWPECSFSLWPSCGGLVLMTVLGSFGLWPLTPPLQSLMHPHLELYGYGLDASMESQSSLSNLALVVYAAILTTCCCASGLFAD